MFENFCGGMRFKVDSSSYFQSYKTAEKERGCPKSSKIRNSRHPELVSGSDY